MQVDTMTTSTPQQQQTHLGPIQKEYTADETKALRLNVHKEKLHQLIDDVYNSMDNILELYFDGEMDSKLGDMGFDGLAAAITACIPGFAVFGIISGTVSEIINIVSDVKIKDQWGAAQTKLDEAFEKLHKQIDADDFFL